MRYKPLTLTGTLASEEVWQKTHRVGGRIWVLGGVLCLVAAPVREVWGAYLLFAALLVMTLIPVVYSYLLFQKVQKG